MGMGNNGAAAHNSVLPARGSEADELFPTHLNEANEYKDNAKVAELGGVAGIAAKVGSSLSDGLRTADVGANVAKFGPNRYKEVPPKSFLRCMVDNLKDPILWLLMFAATVSTVLGAALEDHRKENGWAEGVAIWIAVLVVDLVSSVNDYQKDQQFRVLNAAKEVFDVTVVRDGHQVLVPNHELCVGDVMVLDTGDKVAADCLLLETFGLVVDEASLTGESDPIAKTPASDPWIRSGTQVNEGSGKCLVIAVGTSSEWGRTMAVVSESGSDQTPLQEKLSTLAGSIGKVGSTVAIACFVILLVKWCVRNKGFPLDQINENGPVQFFMYAITIVVVSIPEGLPLAVTIALAYSMKRMMKDNNFVRVLAACETMGGATAICSDKTGTLTENRMSVVEGWFAGQKLPTGLPDAADLPPAVADGLFANIALNSKAFLVQKEGGAPAEFVGNRTDCALLTLLGRWGGDYEEMRRARKADIARVWEFSSERKMASVLVREGSGSLRLHTKGAAEWVLKLCTTFHDGPSPRPLDGPARQQLLDVVTEMASRGLRCIALATAQLPSSFLDAAPPADDPKRAPGGADAPPEEKLRLLAIVGIKDPVRAEVPAAVETCRKAGITVRMVTGDNIHTAKHIARECGLLTAGGLALEGPQFRSMPVEELKALLPKLNVLARASPKDKHTLVATLKSMGEVVAVTGDGTNDAPALKESDVGLAMGIAGTEVAKEAADIVIMDDNFSSIVKSVLWGRSVFNNIRKFLQFQLTINLVALIVAFVGALAGGHEPLTVMQLLWVNLIMDSLAALALATEPPHPRLLDKRPAGRAEPLITRRMLKHIVVQGAYQVAWLFLFLYAFPVVLPRYKVASKCNYFAEHCVEETQDHRRVGAPEAQRLCASFVDYSAPQCKLLPFKEAAKACTGGTAGCPSLKELDSLEKHLVKEWHKQQEKDLRKALSLLFNTFIFCQVGNFINSRRIDDEYNVFEGIFSSTTFMVVLVIILACQAIIMNFLGTFFKVVPLNGWEWLISFGIGLGSLPLSFLTRLISRAIPARHKAT